MTEEQAHRYYGQNVCVHCKDGDTVEGFLCIFTYAYDNDPEVAEITLDVNGFLVGIPLPDIDHIDIIAE